MFRKLRSPLATLLILAGLLLPTIPALADQPDPYAAWLVDANQERLAVEAVGSVTCSEAGYSLTLTEKPRQIALTLPVECPNLVGLVPGDSGLVGTYRLRYDGPGAIDLWFNSKLDGPLFAGEHPIAVSIVDGQGNSYHPNQPDQRVGTLRTGGEFTLKVTYDWNLAAANEYQGLSSYLLMSLVAKGRSGGGGPSDDGDGPEEYVTTGRIVVRVLGDPMGDGSLVPLRGASVSLAGITATTDDLGQVVFDGLTFGEYSATATAVNPVTGTEPRTGSGRTQITADEPESYITIVLTWAPPVTPPDEPVEPPEEPVKPPEVFTGSITVRVLDGSDRNQGTPRPLAGAIVQAGPVAGRTDADGQIRLANLPLARYIVFAEAIDPANPESGERRSGTRQVNLTREQPDQTATILLAWADAAAAPDTTPGSIKGRICAPRAPGARVWATNEAGQVAAVAVAAIDRLGVWLDYLIPDLPPGPWTLTLQYPDEPAVSQSVIVRPGEVTHAPDFTLACTGDGEPRPSVVGYLLAGIVLLLAGIRLRQTA